MKQDVFIPTETERLAIILTKQFYYKNDELRNNLI